MWKDLTGKPKNKWKCDECDSIISGSFDYCILCKQKGKMIDSAEKNKSKRKEEIKFKRRGRKNFYE